MRHSSWVLLSIYPLMDILTILYGQYPLPLNLLIWSVCQILAVLPATSVDCERGFSNVSRIKTNLRNRLMELHLESLLRISTIKMDALTFYQHREVLTRRWKMLVDRRTAGKGNVLYHEEIIIIVEWVLWTNGIDLDDICILSDMTYHGGVTMDCIVVVDWIKMRLLVLNPQNINNSIALATFTKATFQLSVLALSIPIMELEGF